MSKVVMYTSRVCPFCITVKQLFNDIGVLYEEIRVDQHTEIRVEMVQRSGRRTVPQVFIGDRHVGGCDDAQNALQSGELKIWLEEIGIHV